MDGRVWVWESGQEVKQLVLDLEPAAPPPCWVLPALACEGGFCAQEYKLGFQAGGEQHWQFIHWDICE